MGAALTFVTRHFAHVPGHAALEMLQVLGLSEEFSWPLYLLLLIGVFVGFMRLDAQRETRRGVTQHRCDMLWRAVFLDGVDGRGALITRVLTLGLFWMVCRVFALRGSELCQCLCALLRCFALPRRLFDAEPRQRRMYRSTARQ